MGGRERHGREAVTTTALVAAPPPAAGRLPSWERWGWVAVRVVAGWYWLDHGSRALASASGVAGSVLATGEVLAGIAVLLGFATGTAALMLSVAGGLAVAAGDRSALVPLAASVALVAAWRRAGAVGFDRWLLGSMRGRWFANREPNRID